MKNQSINRPTDIAVRDEGSVFLIEGVSDTGSNWLNLNLDPDALRFGFSYVVEHRYVLDIINGAAADGLAVRRG